MPLIILIIFCLGMCTILDIHASPEITMKSHQTKSQLDRQLADLARVAVVDNLLQSSDENVGVDETKILVDALQWQETGLLSNTKFIDQIEIVDASTMYNARPYFIWSIWLIISAKIEANHDILPQWRGKNGIFNIPSTMITLDKMNELLHVLYNKLPIEDIQIELKQSTLFVTVKEKPIMGKLEVLSNCISKPMLQAQIDLCLHNKHFDAQEMLGKILLPFSLMAMAQCDCYFVPYYFLLPTKAVKTNPTTTLSTNTYDLYCYCRSPVACQQHVTGVIVTGDHSSLFNIFDILPSFTSSNAVLNFLLRAQSTNPQTIKMIDDGITNFYHNKGYCQVQTCTRVMYSLYDESSYLIVDIQQNDPHIVGDVHLEILTDMPDDLKDKIENLLIADDIYNDHTLQKIEQDINDLLRQHVCNADVVVTSKIKEKGKVDIYIKINPIFSRLMIREVMFPIGEEKLFLLLDSRWRIGDTISPQELDRRLASKEISVLSHDENRFDNQNSAILSNDEKDKTTLSLMLMPKHNSRTASFNFLIAPNPQSNNPQMSIIITFPFVNLKQFVFDIIATANTEEQNIGVALRALPSKYEMGYEICASYQNYIFSHIFTTKDQGLIRGSLIVPVSGDIYLILGMEMEHSVLQMRKSDGDDRFAQRVRKFFFDEMGIEKLYEKQDQEDDSRVVDVFDIEDKFLPQDKFRNRLMKQLRTDASIVFRANRQELSNMFGSFYYCPVIFGGKLSGAPRLHTINQHTVMSVVMLEIKYFFDLLRSYDKIDITYKLQTTYNKLFFTLTMQYLHLFMMNKTQSLPRSTPLFLPQLVGLSQGLGTYIVNEITNIFVGGTSLFMCNTQLLYRISSELPNLYGAVFCDVGHISGSPLNNEVQKKFLWDTNMFNINLVVTFGFGIVVIVPFLNVPFYARFNIPLVIDQKIKDKHWVSWQIGVTTLL